MGDLNISRQFAQRLNDDTSRRLVTEILADSEVNSADKAKLDELKKHLAAAVADPKDSDTQELIENFTDLSTILGVNVGTDKEVLRANLSRLKAFQDSMMPNEVDFSGMSVTMDGWLGDTNRVLRLRDLEDSSDIESPPPSGTSGPETPDTTKPTPPSTTDTAVPTQPIKPIVTSPNNTPPLSVPNLYVPQETYTPTTAPSINAPISEIPSELTTEQQQELGQNQSAYNQSVNTLQTQTTELRNLLNNPQSVTNEQLLSSLQRLAENDSGKGFLEVLRFNPNLLNELQQKGLISESDRKNLSSTLNDVLTNKSQLESGNQKIADLEKQVQGLQSQLGNTTDANERKSIQDKITELKSQIDSQNSENTKFSNNISSAIDKITNGQIKFENGKTPTETLTNYLKSSPTPINDAQLNAYRASLVKSADDYLSSPNQSTFANLRSNLYSNLYVFEKGVPAAQEQTYVKFKEALLDTSQKKDNLTHQIDAMTGKTNALDNVTTGSDLAFKLQQQQQGSADAVASFVKQGESILAYLKAYPNQYEGQAADAAALEAKLNSLKTSKDPQAQMTLLNQVSSALDEVYIKTGISKGSTPEIDATKAALISARDKLTSDEDKKKMDLLINNPELFRLLPKASDYASILSHLSNKPLLTAQEKELKTALENGDTDKVNAIFTADMFNSFGFGSLSLGGAFFTGFGLGMSTFFSPPPPPVFSPATLDTSLLPQNPELQLGGTSGVSAFELGGINGGLGSTSLSNPYQLNSPNLSYSFVKPTPPPPLWLSVPGGSSRADALSKELASLPPDRREALVAALKSPEMAGMTEFIQRVAQEQPDLKQQLDKVQAGEVAREAMNVAHWNNDSLLDAAQTSLQTQIQTSQAMKAEFSLAKKELEQLIANPDLSAPVKEKLQEQLKVVNSALTSMNAGKFPPQDPAEQEKLDTVLKAISVENKPQGLTLPDRLMHQATVDVLSDLSANPDLMKKLESAPSFKDLTHLFEKDEQGNYTFPQEMTNILQDKNLSPEAAQMLMLQVNRVSHLANVAKTKSVEEIESILKVGKQQTAAGNGGGELTSGMDALVSLNTFKANTKSNSMSQYDPVTLMNNIAKEVGPLDLSQENREMRRTVNQAFMNNVSMVKNVAQEQLNNLDAATRNNLQTNQTGLSEQLKKPETLALLKPALDAGVISEADLNPPLDKGKLDKIEAAIAASKEAITKKPELANTPAAQAQLKRLDDLDKARLAVVNLIDTVSQSQTGMLTMMEDSKKEYLTGMSGLRDELKAKGLSTPKLDAFIQNPNSVSYTEVLAELDALKSHSNPDVQALANGLKSMATSVHTIAMAQSAIENGTYDDSTEALLLGALGSGVRVREFMATYAREKQTLGAEAASRNLQQNLGALADRIEGAGTNPGAMVLALSNTGPSSPNQSPTTSGSHQGTDLATALGPPIGRALQTVINFGETQRQFRASGITIPRPRLADLGMQGFNPPDRDQWYPGKILGQIANNIRERRDIVQNTPPSQLDGVMNIFNRTDQISARADNTFLRGMESYLKEVNPAMQAAGLPGVDLSYIDNSDPLAEDPSFSDKAELSSKAQELVDKADELANAILSPKPMVDGRDALAGLLKDFLDNIRNLDFQTRKLVMAQFTKRLMNNMITKLYAEKNLENAKYHEKSLDQFKARMKEGIERILESQEAQASSGQAAMAVGGDLGAKTGSAIADAGISDRALRDEASQFLEPAVQDGVLSRVQKQKILQALFDGSSITGQEGLMAMLSRFQQVNSLITQ